MSRPAIHFLFKNQDEKAEIVDFLTKYYLVQEEALAFSMDGIKTKDLHKEMDQRKTKHHFDYLLIQDNEQLMMFDSEKRKIHIDFDQDKLNYARKVLTKDPFLRAVGRDRKKVIDVSAGLGIDSVFLAQHGHDVVAVERNPLLFTLLNYAQKKSESLKRLKIRFEFSEASDFVQKKTSKDDIDCIYFDPMFPDKPKSALPKQEMVLFRKLVGSDIDAEAVLENLLKVGTRVVVKRPSHAPPIGFKPTNAFESKLIRFDIY